MLAMTKSATVFVNYLASQYVTSQWPATSFDSIEYIGSRDIILTKFRANEHASASNRKTINPQDVFNALEDLEFPDFRPRLEAELAS